MVLVILAILAAILVPALLGWIDEARNKQYVLEARSVYLAVQAAADEAYAVDEDVDLDTYFANDGNGALTRVATLADIPIEQLTISKINDGIDDDDIQVNKDSHKGKVIQSIHLTFTGQNGDKVTADLKEGKWTASAAEVSTD